MDIYDLMTTIPKRFDPMRCCGIQEEMTDACDTSA